MCVFISVQPYLWLLYWLLDPYQLIVTPLDKAWDLGLERLSRAAHTLFASNQAPETRLASKVCTCGYISLSLPAVCVCVCACVWTSVVCVCVCIPESSYTDSLPARGLSDQKYFSNLSLKERWTGLAHTWVHVCCVYACVCVRFRPSMPACVCYAAFPSTGASVEPHLQDSRWQQMWPIWVRKR